MRGAKAMECLLSPPPRLCLVKDVLLQGFRGSVMSTSVFIDLIT